MKRCSGCNSEKIKTYDFDEGKIFICQACKLQWAEPADALNKRYNDTTEDIYSYYMCPESIPEPERYAPYLDFFNFLENRLKDKKKSDVKILDVGCGNGIFVKECVRRGYDALGIEADPGLKRMVPYEIKDRVVFKPIEKIDKLSSKFNVITFWDCFEHLEDAFNTLNSLRPYLKERGLVYLRVNNNRDIYNYLTLFLLNFSPKVGKKMLKNCFNFPLHFWNFSQEGLRNLLLKNDWEIICHNISETPASRLTPSKTMIKIINLAYFLNRLIKGGKIGNYYVAPR